MCGSHALDVPDPLKLEDDIEERRRGAAENIKNWKICQKRNYDYKYVEVTIM